MKPQIIFKPRLITRKLQKLVDNFSAVVVLGARQVGKSTLLTHTFSDWQHITFDPVQDILGAREQPELFLNHQRAPLILDEIQYVPELIPSLKRKIDELQQKSLFLLTGSQQWGVIKNIADSMAGRAIIINLEGFCLAEIASTLPKQSWLERWLESPENFLKEAQSRLKLETNIYQQLWRGFLPEAQFLELEFINLFHSSYQKTYIERDVRLLADINDIGLFGKFVRLAAALTAQEINHSQLGRDIGITSQTAKRWLALLNQAFEWSEIPAYSNNSIKRVSGKPKGYFNDTGQVCFSQMLSSPNTLPSHPLFGAIFETAVVGEIRKLLDCMSTPANVYHWRLHSGAECDLILERDGKLYPIEIKAKARPSKKDTRGLQAFRENYKNVQQGLIIAPSTDLYPVTENDYVIPWDLI